MRLYKTSSALEEELGMQYYSSERPALGGVLRRLPEDFVVNEITPEGIEAGPDLWSLDRGQGGHTLALLKKVSRDQLSVISYLSSRLGAQVGFAGIKDRQAVTYQIISIGRRLEQGEVPYDLHDMELRVVGYSRWPVQPGDLKGNRFTIAIRSISPASLQPVTAAAPVEWALNYYGHQRFGTTRPNTHKVGRLMVRRDYEGAVREFLAAAYPWEPSAIRAARSELATGWDLNAALRSFPASLSFERRVIERLLSRPSDYEGCLHSLPQTLLRLFVDAYQSYLFNLALSQRHAQHGVREIEIGDFVAPLDKWGSPSRPFRCNASNVSNLRSMVRSGRAVTIVRVIGEKSDFGGTEGGIYASLLEKEGIIIGDFRIVAGMRFDGALRAATFTPINCVMMDGPDDMDGGKRKLTVRMTLPKSCYATVILREIMRPADLAASGF